MSRKYLTTIDNPFHPAKNFDEWYAFDESKGYHTCSYLARITPVSDSLSDADFESAIDASIDEIVRLNVLGIYKVLTEDVNSP